MWVKLRLMVRPVDDVEFKTEGRVQNTCERGRNGGGVGVARVGHMTFYERDKRNGVMVTTATR